MEIMLAVDDQQRDERADRPDERPRHRPQRGKGGEHRDLREGIIERRRARTADRSPPPATTAAAAAYRSRVAIPGHRSAPRSDRAADWDRAAPAMPSKPRDATPRRRAKVAPGCCSIVAPRSERRGIASDRTAAMRRWSMRIAVAFVRLRGARRSGTLRRAPANRRPVVRDHSMTRHGAVFIAVCMVLIAGSARRRGPSRLRLRRAPRRSSRSPPDRAYASSNLSPPVAAPRFRGARSPICRNATADLAKRVARIDRARSTAPRRPPNGRAPRARRRRARSAALDARVTDLADTVIAHDAALFGAGLAASGVARRRRDSAGAGGQAAKPRRIDTRRTRWKPTPCAPWSPPRSTPIASISTCSRS